MTDLAAFASDPDRTVGDPSTCPDDGFRRDVDVARSAFRTGLLDVITLTPEETEAVLMKFDHSVMEIAAALIAHQVLVRSVRAATQADHHRPGQASGQSLRLIPGGAG